MDLTPLILESTPHCVLVLDGELCLRYANRNFFRFVRENFEQELSVGESVVSAIPEDRQLRYKLRLEEVLSGQCTRLEESLEINGFPRYFDVSYQPLVEEEGRWDKVVIYFEEITARKRKEMRLLEDDAGLKELLATREALLSVISHDLRSPIFQLNGLLFLIKQASEKRDESRLQMQAEDLEERISHLTHTLDNLLSWSNLQRQSLDPKISRFPILPIFEDAIGLHKPTCKSKGVRIYTKGLRGIQVSSDHEMVAFIIRNLINNAIKFSHEGGKIEIAAESLGSGIQFAVADHGVGMDADKLSTLREGSHQFSQSGTWGERGTGLGLKMCYEFTERLSGALHVQSEPVKGTTVTVFLPDLSFS